MEEDQIKIEERVHTEHIQNIIGTPPRWLYRWGITIVLAIALLCILVSSVINYPEAVKTQLQILATHAPDFIVCRDSSNLIKVFVPNDSEVKKGDRLALVNGALGITVIQASVNGRLYYSGIIHENEELAPGQKLFLIAADNINFYGKMIIPKNEVHKVKPGQKVLIKIRNGDEKQSGLTGIIRYIVNDPSKNGEYFAEVDFSSLNTSRAANHLLLRNEMVTDAEIITAKATLLQRLFQSLIIGIK